MKYDELLELNDRNSLSLLINRITPNSKVLEFGPANGRMTKYLKEELGCLVYAVELDEDAAKYASLYTEKMVVGNIESCNWKEEFHDVKFDFIVFADVLEHLYYPEKVLSSLHSFMQKDASILISIPNISHNSIVMGLLNNEFNYTSTGLLDDTHIRFYTKKTFDKLINDTGYFRSYETAVFKQPQSTEFNYLYDDFPDPVKNYISSLPYGEVYQYVYELKNYAVDVISDFEDEYNKDTSKYVQLFIDTGDGVSEESSIKLIPEKFEGIQKAEFDLSNKENMQAIRFDILNDYCVVKINQILINESEEVTFIDSNANHVDGDVYYFGTNDSQINIIVDNETKKLSVEFEYLNIGNKALELLIDKVSKEFSSAMEAKNQELAEIYASKTWKIINLFQKRKK